MKLDSAAGGFVAGVSNGLVEQLLRRRFVDNSLTENFQCDIQYLYVLKKSIRLIKELLTLSLTLIFIVVYAKSLDKTTGL